MTTAPAPARTIGAPATGSRGHAGDGGPGQTVGEPWAARLRRWRPVALALLLVAALTLATLWARPQTSTTPLAIDNPTGTGTMALAELLRREGIEVSTATRLEDAMTAAHQGGTVAVIAPSALSAQERRALAESGGDIVVVGSLYEDLSGLSRTQSTGISGTGALTAQCEDPDAQAARSIASSKGSLEAEPADQVQGCFPIDDGGFAYTTEPLAGGGTLRILADSSLVTNARLAQEGHAALGVRALGHHERLVWLDATRVGRARDTDWQTPSLPPWMPGLMIYLGATVIVLAVIRGRRMGAIIPERLPAVVRSTETTVARGRLYRRAADRQRASQALRTGSILRLGRAVGLGAGVGRDVLLAALERATGVRHDQLDDLLYGPVPASDQALADLAVNLDHLESKVHSYD